MELCGCLAVLWACSPEDSCAYAAYVVNRDQVRGAGRRISVTSDFDTDDGAPAVGIRESTGASELMQALAEGRVLVAVVASVDEADEHGSDKSSHMSVVSMISADGRRGLLGFTGLDSLHAWNPSARPVPVTGVDAARAAIEDGCEALVLDIAGPHRLVVPEVDLLTLAGIDAVAYARELAAEVLSRVEGLTEVSVGLSSSPGRLRLVTPQSLADRAVASLSPRILALVPDGVEVVHE